ncbi:aminoglycoside phosphotransferase [Paenibacillus hemerocallicola]|uniref:Aminoglycoside phosphotransferase n=1 Tax=Paenibacillus hemerocallicola TaxID=1172614 RepID=A0A5C4THQ4_9BACL|nr:phosphotransferase [Paenibacillus hemerocallicola]TNJ68107.1 aminoglycoside phosphotransferase [Paenibacillus hemerocallicola]
MKYSNLQQLFDEPIEKIQILDPGYSGHASDVWLVKTASQEVVVRSSRWRNEPDREFWWGCKFMFGIDPRHMIYMKENSKLLQTVSEIALPKILSWAEMDGREYLVVEKMKGHALSSFKNQSHELLYQFGVWLAKVHLNTSSFYGNLAKTKVGKREEFHNKLAQAMKGIAEREYPSDSHIRTSLDPILEQLHDLPHPQHFCPILVDMDPSQFLAEAGKITAIVDTEAYVIAPREFDFIGLEYVLDEASSASFLNGYTTILGIPELSECRRAYRYFYRLLGVQGSVDLDKWFAQSELF